jgi:hypothetical protein
MTADFKPIETKSFKPTTRRIITISENIEWHSCYHLYVALNGTQEYPLLIGDILLSARQFDFTQRVVEF